MTTPPVGSVGLDALKSMLSAGGELADQPGLLYSLAKANASPQQAAGINQFLSAMRLANQVRMHRAVGTPLLLDDGDRQKLDALGVQYNDIEATPFNQASYAAPQAVAQAQAQASGKAKAPTAKDSLVFVRDAQGNIEHGSDGKPIVTTAPGANSWYRGLLDQQKASKENLHYQAPKEWSQGGGITGWLDQHVVSPITTGLGDVANAVTAPVRAISNLLGSGLEGLTHPQDYVGAPGMIQQSMNRQADMQAKGLDPSNIWDNLNYAQSGDAKDPSQIQNLIDKYGREQFDMVAQYMNDPKKFQQALYNDPSIYTTDPQTGMPKLTADGAQRIKFLNSPEWRQAVSDYQRAGASIGDTVARHLAGISIWKKLDDPDGDRSFAAMSLGTNLAAGFALDPFFLASRINKALKLAQVGRLDGEGKLLDTPSIIERITGKPYQGGTFQPKSRIPGVAAPETAPAFQGTHFPVPTDKALVAYRSKLQSYMDMVGAWRKAQLSGDEKTAAALDTKLARRFPDLDPLRGEVAGTERTVGFKTVTNEEGHQVAEPIVDNNAPPARTLDDIAPIIANRAALVRVLGGKAIARSPYLPGAASGYGARWIASQINGMFTNASSYYKAKTETQLLEAAAKSPEVRDRLISDGQLLKFPAEAHDAARVDGTVLSSPGEAIKADLDAAMQALSGERASLISAHGAFEKELEDLQQQYSEVWSSRDWSHLDPGEFEKFQTKIDEMHSLIQHADELIAENNSNRVLLQEKMAAGLPQAETGAVPEAAPQLPSQVRGIRDAEGNTLVLTPKGKGTAALNMQRYGTALGAGNRAFGWVTPAAMGARMRSMASTFGNLLPRNTEFDIMSPLAAEKVYQYAKMFLGRADAAALRSRWIAGDFGTRKAVLDSMLEQMAHASGLLTTESGRKFYAALRTEIQSYSLAGDKLYQDGQPVAVWAGQANRVWKLPEFSQWQKVAAKVGLWENTFGRPLTATQADQLISTMKIGWLLRPATISRNQLEAWLKILFEGRLGDALRAHAVSQIRLSEAVEHYGYGTGELAEYSRLRQIAEEKAGEVPTVDMLSRNLSGEDLRQLKVLRSHPVIKLKEQQERIDSLKSEIAAADEGGVKISLQHQLDELTDNYNAMRNGSMLSGQRLGRSPLANRVANLAFMAKIGQAYRSLFLADMPEEVIRAILDLGPAKLSEYMDAYSKQIMTGELQLSRSLSDARDMSHDGFAPGSSSLKRAVANMKKGRKEGGLDTTHWVQHEIDGTEAADRYATALAIRVNDDPAVAKAVIAELESENPNVDNIVAAMDKAYNGTGKGRMLGWGQRYWKPEGGEAIPALPGSAEAALGKKQFAEEMLADMRAHLLGRNGEISPVAKFIKDNGFAPDSHWISNELKLENLPHQVLAPKVLPLAAGGEAGFWSALNDLGGAAHSWLVERTLQRTTTSPAFLAAYGRERVALNGVVDELVKDGGLTREAASNLAEEVAVRNAWSRAEDWVDDPGQKTQFDVVMRNVFPFARATQAMIRRWGGGLWRDPVQARKMMLAYEAATYSGAIQNDTFGDPTFVYPGSGVMFDAMQELAKLPGFGNIARFPLAADLTGNALMAVPGADNPLRMSLSPLIMIPMRELRGLFPGSVKLVFDQIDAAINGPIGVGTTFQGLEPTVIKRIQDAYDVWHASPDDQNGMFAAAFKSAYAYLAAAGMVPSPSDPPEVQQQFKDRLATQLRSNLYIQIAFGLWAPARDSLEINGAGGVGKSDYALQLRGVKNLADEYKTILNDVNGNVGEAMAIFTSLHPDKYVFNPVDLTYTKYQPTASAFETSGSKVATPGAQVPITQEATSWMAVNKDFMQKYDKVAAYFMPMPTAASPFDEAAYKEQMLLGIRQRKSPTEFINDVAVRVAESIYYPAVDKINGETAAAQVAGDIQKVKQLQQLAAQYKSDFKDRNPAFKAKDAAAASGGTLADEQFAQLQEIVQHNSAPDGLGTLLGQMVKSYSDYKSFINDHRGTDHQSSQMRDNALFMLDSWAAVNVAGTPLADLWNGVFRNMNTNLLKLPAEQQLGG